MGTPGYPKQQVVSGRWSVPYSETLNNSGFAAKDFRSASYFGACPWMTAEQKALAITGGRLKSLEIRLLSTSTATSVKVAYEETPGSRYVTFDTSNALSLQIPKEQDVSVLYFDTGGADANVEMVLYFDLAAE